VVLKPGDLVEPEWSLHGYANGNKPDFPRQLGLVLSHPKVDGTGSEFGSCVKVHWVGYEMQEYYSVHHLRLVENED
jgi:hypothetical protein